MTTTHIAHAVGVASDEEPQWRVELVTGTHHLIADEPVTKGGNAGPSPFSFVVSGLAACTAMTLRMYAERKGWKLTLVEVDVRYDLTSDEKGTVARTITLPAELPVEQRERLAEIAERTPVTRMLRAGVPINTKIICRARQ